MEFAKAPIGSLDKPRMTWRWGPRISDTIHRGAATIRAADYRAAQLPTQYQNHSIAPNRHQGAAHLDIWGVIHIFELGIFAQAQMQDYEEPFNLRPPACDKEASILRALCCFWSLLAVAG